MCVTLKMTECIWIWASLNAEDRDSFGVTVLILMLSIIISADISH